MNKWYDNWATKTGLDEDGNRKFRVEFPHSAGEQKRVGVVVPKHLVTLTATLSWLVSHLELALDTIGKRDKEIEDLKMDLLEAKENAEV